MYHVPCNRFNNKIGCNLICTLSKFTIILNVYDSLFEIDFDSENGTNSNHIRLIKNDSSNCQEKVNKI